MARFRPRDIELQDNLQPVAAPVASYVRPADPAPSPLHDLARSLGDLDQSISGVIAKRQSEEREKQELQGQMDFALGNKDGYKAAQEQGAIPIFADPYRYNRGYLGAAGTSMGSELPLDFEQRYLTWDKKDDPNPDSFNAFWTQYAQEKLTAVQEKYGKDAPYVLRTFLPELNRFRDIVQTRHMKDAHDSIVGKSQDVSIGTASSQNDLALTASPDASKVNWDAVNGRWNASRADFAKFGASPAQLQKFDEGLIKRVTDFAIGQEDPALAEKALSFFDTIKPGTNVKWRDTVEGAAAYEQAKKTVEGTAYTKQLRLRELADKKRIEEARGLKTDLLRQLFADPDATLDPKKFGRLGELDPSAQMDMIRDRKTLKEVRDSKEASDPKGLFEIEQQLLGGADAMDAIKQGIGLGIIRNGDDIKSLMTLGDNVKQKQDEYAKVQQDPAFVDVMNTIKSRTSRAPQNGEIIFGPEGAGLTNEGLKAVGGFRRQVLQWMMDNPKATILERQKAISDIGTLWIKSIVANPSVGQPGHVPAAPGEGANPPSNIVAPTTELQKANPETRADMPVVTDGPAGPGERLPPQPQGVPTPPVKPSTPPNLPITDPQEKEAFNTWMQGMTPAEKRMMEDVARQRGADTNSFSIWLWRKQRNAMEKDRMAPPPGQPTPSAQPVPGKQSAADTQAPVVMSDAAPAFDLADGMQLAMLTPNEVATQLRDNLPELLGQEAAQAALTAGQVSQPQGRPLTGIASAYSPMKGGDRMEGGYAASRPGPDGNTRVSTIQDYVEGRSPYVTLAGSPTYYGRRYVIREITANIGGQPVTLRNVPAVVHDTGGAFVGAPEGRFDIAAERDNAEGTSSQPYSQKPIEFVSMGTPIRPGPYVTFTGGNAVDFLAARTHHPREAIARMDPELTNRVAALINDAPPAIKDGLGVYSGFRDSRRQAELYAASDKSGKWVAPPGRSKHNHGEAVDLGWNGNSLAKAPPEVVRWVHDNAARFGLWFPLSYENWHAEMTGSRDKKAT
jgi:hypothetical protein